MSNLSTKDIKHFRFCIQDADYMTKKLGNKIADEVESFDEKLYQAFKAGCLSANDGILPDAFEEDIRVLFEEWKNGK